MGGRRRSVTAVVAVLALVACTADDPGSSTDASAEPSAESVESTGDGQTTGGDEPPVVEIVGSATMPPVADGFTVVEVVDGDTLTVDGPSGVATVRLIGINAPERGECFYDQATDGLRFFVAGRTVQLATDRTETDQYDRLLRFVETSDGTDGGDVIDVGAELIRAGFAISRRYEPDTSRNDRYDELQREAKEAGRGLWAPDACGAPTAAEGGGDSAAARVSVEIQFDAPGDDNLNLGEEWVRFVNDGPDDLDLTGWQVADSGPHRYTFGNLVVAPGASVTLVTGCGTDTGTTRYWCNRDSAIWNNSGDTVFLRDASGNTVLAETYPGN